MADVGVRPGAGAALPALALGAVLTACAPPSPATLVVPLDRGWVLTGADTFTITIPATVPGTVHTDLLEAGLIPDPFWRDNEEALQWIGERDWSYRTVFRAGPALLEADAVELVFHGLDTFAEVLLNDRPILSADNMFRRWEVEVGRLLIPGDNTLEVRLRSPLPPALAARAALLYELPAGNDRGDPPSRVFVRKAAYHYGWDWGPRFVTMGIWRPVELVAWRGARITDLHLLTDSLSGSGAFLRARVELNVSRAEAERRAAGDSLPAILTLSSPEGAFGEVSRKAVLEPGANRFELPLVIPEPELWWPAGLGEPRLYTVQAVLRAGLRADTVRTRIGLRTVELVTEPDSVGESFYFRVNGVPVFMKGANVIPLDHFTPRVREEDYRRLFRDAAAARMNMLRVWGGGVYQEDLFYELADEHGILIWQDFMFANGMYPGDSTFLAGVEAEATDQIRRLRRHPSLALWCGNNEVDEGWHNWGWARGYASPADSAAVWRGYQALFHDLLPRLVSREDPGRAYLSTSPTHGWGRPQSLTRGSAHYWGVWHGEEPFQRFQEKLPRFMSEFGFQGFPPMETLEAFTEPGDRSLSHPVLLAHQKHPVGNEIIRRYMARDYPVPSSLEDFVYVSQLLQARGMRLAFEAHRRAKPRTMGTLYWQLNDSWPGITWSGRDYFGRWKALHFAAREAFAPLLISPVIKGDTVEVWLVSELPHPREGTLSLELLDFRGTVHRVKEVPAVAGANESRRIWAGARGEILGAVDPREAVLVVEFVEEAGSSSPPGAPAPSLLYFTPPKELALEAPAIRVEVAPATPPQGERTPPREGPGLLLTLEADRLAKDVHLILEGTFQDNFFDLLPGRSREILVRTPLSPEDVRSRLRIRTLAEVPREGSPPRS